MEWLNEPPSWEGDASRLHVRTGPDTDFWRETHYGFIRDNGHAYLTRVTGDFVATVEVEGHYRELYDQAGLMVRASPTDWLKAGIEFVDGAQLASVVVTRTYSDWSATPLEPAPERFAVRVTREGTAVSIDGSTDGGATWRFMRVAWLSEAAAWQVGPMCATPQGSGFDVVFHDLRIETS